MADPFTPAPAPTSVPMQQRYPTSLRVVSNAEMDQQEAAANNVQQQAQDLANPTPYTGLVGHIRNEWDMMRRHRDTVVGWSERLLAALRAFNGVYDPAKLVEIKKFGGSEVYARLIAAKCRGASSLLRDVYLGADRSWGLEPESDPPIPGEIEQAIQSLIQSEVQQAQSIGMPIQPQQIRDRLWGLMAKARIAAKKNAEDKARLAEDKIDEILTEGNFYGALAEVLVDVPLFPYAVLKGPSVRMVFEVDWSTGRPVMRRKPKLWWERISPFDVYWTPGVADIEDASIVERTRLTRTDLNDLLDIPGYDTNAIRQVLDNYGRGGLALDWDVAEAPRAKLESREDPWFNQSHMISCLQFTGNVQGRMLLDYGFSPDDIPDPIRDYAIEAWMIGSYLIKVQLGVSPRRRHKYYVTSWEKVPGTPVGNAIPDQISDLQEVCNASMRSLVNNMSIASGPQVVINDERMAGIGNDEDLYPWKRWRVTNPLLANNSEKPVDFFQPQSNANELLGVFKAIYDLSDDVSAIPKYLSGNSPGGGAGRTASGLAMLMGNASKLLQTVCANIDRDMVNLALTNLVDIVLLTDQSGMLAGTETITPKGVAVAMQKETMRQRQVEFLQVTANPIDMSIIGPKGRAAVLRSVSNTIGMPGDEIVPSKDELEQQQQQAAQVAMAQGAAGHQQVPGPGGPGGGEKPSGGPPGGSGGQGGGGPGGSQPGAPSQQPHPGGDSTKAQAPREALFVRRPQ
jgi:hypothetical protein